MDKIVHITPHMGGGVGNVICGLMNSDIKNKHRVVLLEEPIELKHIYKVNEYEKKFFICPNRSLLHQILTWSDIVIVHWWHHPLTSYFLYELPKMPLRVVIWSHISNLTIPVLDARYILEATSVFFTTESSYDSMPYQKIDDRILFEKTAVVPGTIGFEDSLIVEKKTHPCFNIGYLGYIDFSKLHSEFVEFCDEVKVNNVKFVMGGEAPVRKILEEQAIQKGIADKFEYKGYIKNGYEFYSTIDVLGYPLMPNHTCTTENSILEAMISEIPPVLINQLVEKKIVTNGENGFLVSNKIEYGQAIKILHDNVERRIDMGKKARSSVLRKYGRQRILCNFQDQCEKVMKTFPKIFDFSKILGKTPDKWFLSGIGEEKKMWELNDIRKCADILKGESKASIKQYTKYFNKNKQLVIWEKLVSDLKDKTGED